MNCYNSSDPAAVNATIVYDDNDHHGDLWSRSVENVQDHPLLRCSSTSLPPEARCTVCLDQVVYAVCNKLKDGVVLTMEALQHIKISKSDCPKLLSDAAPQWPLFVAVALIMFFIIFFVVCLYWRCCRNQMTREDETQKPQEADPFLLSVVQQEAPEASS